MAEAPIITPACALTAYVKLLRAHRAVMAVVERSLAGTGLTLTQLGVLEAILHKGPMTQREIGHKVLTSPGNLTEVIDRLQARGLVARVPVPEDRRSVRVLLTTAGEAMIADLFPRHAGDIGRAMGGLTSAELEQLGVLLRQLGKYAEAEENVTAVPPCAGPGRGDSAGRLG